MTVTPQFRTLRLTGLPPAPSAAALYERLFAEDAKGGLVRDIQDWSRHSIAPWTLSHAGNEVGVGGFRIGFAEEGLEVLFHFVPEVWGQGLASEFLNAALEYGRGKLREESFFGFVDPEDNASLRVMKKAGFEATPEHVDGRLLMRSS